MFPDLLKTAKFPHHSVHKKVKFQWQFVKEKVSISNILVWQLNLKWPHTSRHWRTICMPITNTKRRALAENVVGLRTCPLQVQNKKTALEFGNKGQSYSLFCCSAMRGGVTFRRGEQKWWRDPSVGPQKRWLGTCNRPNVLQRFNPCTVQTHSACFGAANVKQQQSEVCLLPLNSVAAYFPARVGGRNSAPVHFLTYEATRRCNKSQHIHDLCKRHLTYVVGADLRTRGTTVTAFVESIDFHNQFSGYFSRNQSPDYPNFLHEQWKCPSSINPCVRLVWENKKISPWHYQPPPRPIMAV